MKMVFARVAHGRAGIFIAAAMFVAVGLTACGTASGAAATAAATATPNCTRTRTVQAVTGTISSVSANSIQVTSASGQATAVQIASTTRITRIVTATAASLTTGTAIQVTPDKTGSTALRIVITPRGANGFGGSGGNGGAGGARGTPAAGFNAACARTRTPGTGPFQGGGAAAGTRGTVTSASSVHVVLTDTSGDTLAFAITPATVILTSAAGTASDLTQGSKVAVTGTQSGSTLVARTIVVQPSGTTTQ